MRELGVDGLPGSWEPESGSFVACLATILELSPDELPEPSAVSSDPADFGLARWLGRFGVGLVAVREPSAFSWPGPWIAWARSPAGARRAVVMYGVPSGLVFDPSGDAARGPDGQLDGRIESGFVLAAGDIALARPPRAPAPSGTGRIVSIHVAENAATPTRSLERARLLAGRGIDGDRHVDGRGTFPSGVPGSALTLIDGEVCESLGLTPDEHRRNIVTEGIDLNALVGRDFRIGRIRCRGTRLCEPCTVIQRYAGRPVLRPLVHRGGLRADILEDGEIEVGAQVDAEG